MRESENKFTTVLLIRHGETDWNRDKIFRGTHDIPLNDNGRSQARLVEKALVDRRIDVAYTSPLSRALETAEIVLRKHNIVPQVSEGLMDFNYGNWTGMKDEEVIERWPDEHRLWNTAPHTARPPGGDTLQHIFSRSFELLSEVVAEHKGRTVVLFTHRVVNKLLILGMFSLDMERFPFIRQDNCCINEFQWVQNQYIVVSLNNVCHLKAAGVGLFNMDF